MVEPVRLSLAEAEALACDALVASRTSPENARPTARALVAAEADGQAGHGLSRVPSYAIQSRAGKVAGFAKPRRRESRRGGVARGRRIRLRLPGDRSGDRGTRAARDGATASQSRRSTVRTISARRAHTPSGWRNAAWSHWCSRTRRRRWRSGAGARRCWARTRSRSAPRCRAGLHPLVIDLAMSVAARGKIVAAEKAGKAIPGRLGGGCRGPADHGPEGRAGRHAAADRRRQGRRARPDDRDPRCSSHGQRIRLGSEFVLRRQGRPAEHGTRVHRDGRRPPVRGRVRQAA